MIPFKGRPSRRHDACLAPCLAPCLPACLPAAAVDVTAIIIIAAAGARHRY